MGMLNAPFYPERLDDLGKTSHPDLDSSLWNNLEIMNLTSNG